jgi:hypothetical protein
MRCASAGCWEQVVEVLAGVALCVGHRDALRTALGGAPAGIIYYLTWDAGGTIKIGTTVTPKSRFKDHRRRGDFTVLVAHPGGLTEEATLHHRFRHLRVPGERELFRNEGALAEHVVNARRIWPNWRELVAEATSRATEARRTRRRRADVTERDALAVMVRNSPSGDPYSAVTK